MDLQQLATSDSLDIPKSTNCSTVEQRLCIGTGESADHVR
jgi:hypothetical protein